MFDTYEAEEAGARYWWVFIITGLAWLLFSIIVFRWDYTTVRAISLLFGIVLIFAGASEMIALFVVRGGWWKALHAVLGILFIVIGIIAFTMKRIPSTACSAFHQPPLTTNSAIISLAPAKMRTMPNRSEIALTVV